MFIERGIEFPLHKYVDHSAELTIGHENTLRCESCKLAVRDHVKVARDMFAEFSRIVFCPVYETRFAATQKWQPHNVNAGYISDAAVVSKLSFVIEHRDVEPGVIRAKAGCPDYGTDLAVCQTEIQTW